MIKKVINLYVLSLAIVVMPVVHADKDHDVREKIYLNKAEKHHLLSEMRLFLSSVQQIVKGVSEDDLKHVAVYAKKSGKAGGVGAPSTLGAKLPKEFRMLGSKTHTQFDQLALDASDLEDGAHALTQLSDLMKNCMSCHATYKIELVDEE